MCGIAGFITNRDFDGLSRDLREMARAIAHRGPDDEGFLETSTRNTLYRVGLAHRRLSIIDLSTGHQPMSNEDGSVQIVFNGEIYNFQALRADLIARGYAFRTKSDTETIVYAYQEWGPDCVSRFRGMFAFAIWDAKHERLFLARDRFGKKPLFLYESAGTLAFASEIKAILKFPGVSARVNHDCLGDYFSYRYVPGPATLFAGIRKLAPGSYAVWERGVLTESRYFLPADGNSLHESAVPTDPVSTFLQILDESVRIRMISDVPFGAFLSGGIDSSAVVGLMSRHSQLPIKTYSVGFSEAKYSELDYARTIAAQFKTDHHELVIAQKHFLDNLPALVRYRDAPVAEPSDIPIYLLSVEARRTVKMVLTGEGSDEFLGGYPKHVYERYATAYQKIPRYLRSRLIEPVSRALPYGARRIKTAIFNLGIENRAERMPRWFGAISNKERDELLNFAPSTQNHLDAPQFATQPGNSALRNILYFDQTSWLPDNLLERGDRMTMAASIEARMPFMDHELAAYVSGLPDEWRVRGRQTKRILREAMKLLLPAKILDRPKVGFRVPINEWFRTDLSDYLRSHLSGPQSVTCSYYRPAVLRRYLDEHQAGRQNHEKLLWTMLNLEIWHREYGVSV
jgi:asparagine synthase (glutamine-hydrolysing)